MQNLSVDMPYFLNGIIYGASANSQKVHLESASAITFTIINTGA